MEYFQDPKTKTLKPKYPNRENTAKWLSEKQAETVKRATKLQGHSRRNLDIYHINTSIYHLLCIPFTFGNAYVKISKNKGALTKGVAQDAQVMKNFGLSTQDKIADKFRRKNFNWEPVRRTMIENLARRKNVQLTLQHKKIGLLKKQSEAYSKLYTNQNFQPSKNNHNHQKATITVQITVLDPTNPLG